MEMGFKGNRKWAVLLAVVVIAVAFLFWGFPALRVEKPPPQISISVPWSSGIAGQLVKLNVSIVNKGGYASGIVVTLRSDAFSKADSDPIDLSPNTSGSVNVPVTVEDVENREYNVTVTYTYSGMKGSSSKTTAVFYVIPLVTIEWDWDLFFQGNMTSNDESEIFFRVHSGSNSSWTIYKYLTAFARPEGQALGITITPDVQYIEDIVARGKTRLYHFKIKTYNTPPGDYTISVIIETDGLQAANGTTVISVS